MIYLLHISDLHLVVNAHWNNMKEAILASVREKLRGVPRGQKLLVITGDFHNFVDKNYTQAEAFLPQLWEAMDIEPQKDVFVIPGNHDITNGKDEKADKNRKFYVEAIQSNPSMLDSGMETLLASYDDYIEFVKKMKLYPETCGENPVQVHVRTWRNKLHLLHLNTTLIANGKAKKGQMLDVEEATSDAVRQKLRAEKLPCIAIGHNSFYDLLDKHQVSLTGLFSQEYISAYLCGDRHKRNRERTENLIELNGKFSTQTIPNIVCYRSSTDETDTYSDFGMIWHEWEEGTGHVGLKFMKWDAEDQAELHPNGEDHYNFRESMEHKAVAPKPASVKKEKKNNSCWMSNEEILEKKEFSVRDYNVRNFLLGGQCKWSMAFSDRIVTRSIVDKLYQYALDEGIYALVGPGGEGKSTILKQVCVRLLEDGGTIFFYRGQGKLKIPERIPENAVFVMDNPPDSEEFREFLDQMIESERTLILGKRQNEWNLMKKSLEISERDVLDIEVETLSEKEAEQFADCVVNYLRCRKSKKEIKKVFRNNAYGFLYAAMLMVANNNNSLDEIAKKIIENLHRSSPKALYLLACIVMSEHCEVKVDYTQWKNMCNELGMPSKDGRDALSREVSLNGNICQTRHEIISRLFYKELFSVDGVLVLDEVDKIVTSLMEYHLKRYQIFYKLHRRVAGWDCVLRLSGGLVETSLETQGYLIDRILDESKTDTLKNFNLLPKYINNEEIQLIFYKKCFERKALTPFLIMPWCKLLLRRGVAWNVSEPFSPAWIMREFCTNQNADVKIWRGWAQLEDRQNGAGDYTKANSARWIYRRACMNSSSDSDTWLAWARMEVREGSIGSWETENSARWIYKEACTKHKADIRVWMIWARLEEREGNIGDCGTQGSARWIYKEACTRQEADDYKWLTWARMEIRQENIGDYGTVGSARWIYREGCMRYHADSWVWQSWAQLEARQGNIGDYATPNSARWIYKEAYRNHKAGDGLWQSWVRLEEQQGNVGDYETENSAKWLYREACMNYGAGTNVWFLWAQLERHHKNIGDYETENSARWIYREGCMKHNARNSMWLGWAQLEEQQGNVGDYETENSVRWIYRKGCINFQAGSGVWLGWAQLEAKQGNVGDCEEENSARWIYREACLKRNCDSSVWKGWIQLEEEQGNIGNYEEENSARWICREGCMNYIMDSDTWLAWAKLEAQYGNIGDYETENSAKWLYREACLNRNGESSVWQSWAQLEERQGNVGDYETENSVRWICREGCINYNANSDAWLVWARMEVRNGNIGNYEKEGSAKWIFRKKCMDGNAAGNMWLDWAKLEEQEGNIGDYETENSARWIYRECAINDNTDYYVWNGWIQLELQQGNVGDYETENSARWICRTACMNYDASIDVWKSWAKLEEQEGNIGDCRTENSARWIYEEAAQKFINENTLPYHYACMELSQKDAQKAREILRNSIEKDKINWGKLAILEFFCGNVDSGDQYCTKTLMSQMRKYVKNSLYMLRHLYWCAALIGNMEEAEMYHAQMLVHPDYDPSKTSIEDFIQLCREAVHEGTDVDSHTVVNIGGQPV